MALGLALQPLNPQIIRALNLPADQKGVVITSVAPGSDSAEKGLRRGDVIVSVNRQAVTQPQQVIAAVDATKRAGRSSVLWAGWTAGRAAGPGASPGAADDGAALAPLADRAKAPMAALMAAIVARNPRRVTD